VRVRVARTHHRPAVLKDQHVPHPRHRTEVRVLLGPGVHDLPDRLCLHRAVFGIAQVLVPLAALGLVLLMIGAVVTRARREEPSMIAVNVVLLVLAAVVPWGRFGPYPC